MENHRDIDFKEVGTRIREARKAHNLTQEKAAERVFITGQFWSLIESGKKRASVDTYKRMAALFDLTLDDLFYEDAKFIRMQKSVSRNELLIDCSDKERKIIAEVLFAFKIAMRKYSD